MIEQKGLFKWLWRLNAIGIFLVLLAGLFTFVRGELRRYQMSHQNQLEPITSVANDPKGVEKWALGGGIEILGSNYTMVPLISRYSKVEPIDQIVYDKVHNTNIYNNQVAKNILFVNSNDNSSFWLFPTNNQLILEYDISLYLPNITQEQKQIQKAKLIYYKVISKDSTGDLKMTLKDKHDFAISDINGKNYIVLLSSIDRVIFIKNIDNKQLHIIYQKNGIGHSLKFDIDNFKILSDKILPKVKK